MKLPRICIACVVVILVAAFSVAQTTQPATQPAAPQTAPADGMTPADQLLGQMLRPPTASAAAPLQPSANVPVIDATSGAATVAPGAPTVRLLREGTFVVDRTGRLTRSADGQSWEFTFESDGRAMRDPPLVILPNLKLMAMEDAIKNVGRDLRFRVTGMVTEYGGRNYILLEKVVVVPEVTQQF